MKWIENLLCGHKWKVHATKKYIQTRLAQVNFIDEKFEADVTRDVLICEKCGKIKIITY